MAKILRLHDTGSSTHEGWGPTGKIGPHEVERLLDPQGGRAAKVAVSIPSPFARMHLVETALRFVTQGGAAQDSVYHQLVSHFWDVWEMVFNFHQRKLASQRLQIRAWRKDEELAKLRANPATRPLADVLSLYLDGRFAKLTEMHLIYFPGANGVPQLIGGTSPLTLFFPAPNVKPLPVQRPQGGGYYFDNQYVPLANREAAFRDYVYQEFVGDPALTSMAPLVRDTLDRGQLQRWAMDGTASLSNFPILTDASNNQIDVAGVLLRVRPDEGTVRGSDLFIRPTRAGVAGPLPIVLRPGLKAIGKKYYNETLFADSGAIVPLTDARPLKERTLPGPELPYPYLTVNDLLEETLLAVPYEVDEAKFFVGNLKIAPGFRPSSWPLLPIKPAYFDYFTQQDLAEHLSLELESACIRVRLRIPVSGGDYVDYERAYYDNPQGDGVGRLRVTNVALSVFPFVKVADAPQYNDFYKVMLVDANNIDPSMVTKKVDLKFWANGHQLSDTGTDQSATRYERTPKTSQDEGSTYYEVRGTHFDYLEVLNPAPAEGRALIIPRWAEVRQGTKEYRFAIDFGTTNTHVAMQDSPGQEPKPFSFGVADSPVVLLKKSTAEPDRSVYERLYRGIDDDPANFVQIKRWQQYQEREFVPPIIGADSSPYAFPARTATYEAANYATQELSVLGNINVAFGIITEEQRRPNYHTNLKWDNSLNIANTNRVRAFFKEILLLCRAKVALNGGNLAATQITWFAPLSFSTYQRNLYQREWDTLFHDVFKTTNSMPCMVESTAPYYYLTRRNIVTLGPGENAAFIDIGGGTTDVLLYADRKPVLSTSFRFAGNDLWGDGGAEVRGSKDNGLVRFGVAGVQSAVLSPAARRAREYVLVAESTDNFGSEDVASFLFNYDQLLGFSERLLRAEHLRVLFYLHFGALIYHVAQVTVANGQQLPRYLCFTGRGSLYVRLLAAGTNLQPVEKLARLIMEKATGQAVPADFRIKLADDPKQTTANGGVLATGQIPQDPPMVRPVGVLPDPENPLADKGEHHLEAAAVTDEIKQAVLSNARACLKLLLEDPELKRVQADLGVKNDPGLVMNTLERSLGDSFNLYRQQYADVLRDGDTVPETLFFLPFKNALYELSKVLHDAQPLN
ncbi:hypothetical protein MON38_04440 [Hymenobacter sp. DH14]|uniref:Uncharacterized protein n=1 Tax=Hymenobacter cyanobacteriorum TaxID=2926463 RepID=A0A9X2AGT0_9BACT|nr:hypothetical protein [Hymenobacter cyanobacteriorum]MCI1186655.1 hypothetical protein [Hymenobacter cyanobacteriorum]